MIRVPSGAGSAMDAFECRTRTSNTSRGSFRSAHPSASTPTDGRVESLCRSVQTFDLLLHSAHTAQPALEVACLPPHPRLGDRVRKDQEPLFRDRVADH